MTKLFRTMVAAMAALGLLVAGAVRAQEDAAKEVRIDFGVYASDKPTTIVKQFRPLLDAVEKSMAQRMGRTVRIHMTVAPSYEKGLEDIVSGRVHFSRLGPASYVLAKKEFPALKLLAMETNQGEKSFNGVIAVGAQSSVKSVRDLQGKTFAFGDDQSTIGRFLSQLLLLESGVKASTLASYKYLDRHDAVGAAVADGRYDAGALKEGTFKQQVAAGMGLRALVTFPNVTKPWVVHPSMPEAVARVLQQTLLELKDEQAFKQLASDGADGFALAKDEDYDRIRVSIARNPEFFR